MGKLIDLIGQKFGRLTVIKRNGTSKNRQALWLCVCDCGKEKIIMGYNLRKGYTRSCGCFSMEKFIKRSTKHGYWKSHIYKVWANMTQRCTNSNYISYHRYGNRGITVCKRWLKFENFLEDMGELPTNKHQLDRTDNNKGYYRKNCRLVLAKQQARNRRDNRLITFNNKTQTMIEWSEETGISNNTIFWRLNHGWSTEKALTTSVKKRKTI